MKYYMTDSKFAAEDRQEITGQLVIHRVLSEDGCSRRAAIENMENLQPQAIGVMLDICCGL